MIRPFAPSVFVLGTVLALATYPDAARADIRVNGATTVTFGLMQPNRKKIEQLAGVTLAILPSSTTRGLIDLAQGRADIAMLAEPLDTAAASVNQKQPGTIKTEDLVGVHVGNAYVQFIIHPANPIQTLGKAQLAGLFSGKIKNWSELGGANLPVLLIGEPTSSPHRMIADALAISYPPELRVVQNTNQTAVIVAQAPGALSYITSAHDHPRARQAQGRRQRSQAAVGALSGFPQGRTGRGQKSRRSRRIDRHALTVGRTFAHGSKMSMKSLGIKALLALAAIAIPAVVVTAILGISFVRTVKVVEDDVEIAMSTARQIADIRVMIEQEHGLVTRLPAELDQTKVDAYAARIAEIDKKIGEAIFASRRQQPDRDGRRGREHSSNPPRNRQHHRGDHTSHQELLPDHGARSRQWSIRSQPRRRGGAARRDRLQCRCLGGLRARGPDRRFGAGMALDAGGAGDRAGGRWIGLLDGAPECRQPDPRHRRWREQIGRRKFHGGAAGPWSQGRNRADGAGGRDVQVQGHRAGQARGRREGGRGQSPRHARARGDA